MNKTRNGNKFRNLFFCLLLFLFSYPQTQASPSTQKQDIDRLNSDFSAIWNFVQKIPLSPSNKKGLELWRQLVGLDQYQSAKQLDNDLPGIENFMQNKIDTDPGFKEELYQFHSWLEQQYLQFSIPRRDIWFLEEAGKGDFQQLPPGFMWSELMKISHNSPLRAFELLAATNYSPEKIFNLNQPLDFFINKQEKKELQELTEMMKKTRDRNEHFLSINNRINAIYSRIYNSMSIRNNVENVQFSNYNIIALPKSLGANADLSPVLKKRIKDNIDDQTLFAKFYHVHLAAFMSCEMLNTGMNPSLVLFLQKWTAWSYRTVKLNLHLKKIFLRQKEIKNLSPDDKTDLLAADLMSQWFSGHHREDKITIPYSNLSPSDLLFESKSKRIPDPQEPSSRWQNFIGFAKPAEFSDSDFYLAKKRLRLWLTEWDWTIAQHELGATMAISSCKN